MNPVIADLAKGGAEGIFKGVGQFAKDIRSAITGNDPLTAEQKSQLQQKAMDIEVAALQADQAIAQGQIEVNKEEAASPSFFKSGWRPAVGWLCVFVFAYAGIIRPILPWIIQSCGFDVPQMPDIDNTLFAEILFGLLGLGGFRTFEKVRGIK